MRLQHERLLTVQHRERAALGAGVSLSYVGFDGDGAYTLGA